MEALYAIILGIIQGITEFLPVSSFGHDVIISDMLGMNRAGGLLLETMLHLGTLAAVFFMFKTDLIRIGKELLMMTLEAISNLQILIHNRRTGAEMPYHRLITSTYRKLSAMLLVSFLPTAILGFTARRLAEKAAFSPLSTGIGFLVTGVFLLVADFSNSGGERTPEMRNSTMPCGSELPRGFLFSRNFPVRSYHLRRAVLRFQPEIRTEIFLSCEYSRCSGRIFFSDKRIWRFRNDCLPGLFLCFGNACSRLCGLSGGPLSVFRSSKNKTALFCSVLLPGRRGNASREGIINHQN